MALLITGMALTIGPVLPFSYRIVSTPVDAPLPRLDRYQYFEAWDALYGLGRVAERLREEARSTPVTVLVPPYTYASWVLMPHEALRMYLRGDESIRFVETGTLSDPENFCELRRWLRGDTPTFLVTNETHVALGGIPFDTPEYTRRIEVAFARDLPEARLVLHIPRPSGANWLNVYRVDQPAPVTGGGRAGRSEDSACLVPTPSLGAGWHETEGLGSMGYQFRWMADTAAYTAGPLPEGWYRPLIRARPMVDGAIVTLRLNGVDLGRVAARTAPSGGGWGWLESPMPAWIAEGESAHLELEVDRSLSPSEARLGQDQRRRGLEVRAILLRRELSSGGWP
jgi:hypothetical protein